ncbi:hypothetical protein HanIR_Chr17g0877741 [Helianthus annuus]|nr:hypothetical protein HanIR_Chr17g0877741 [Helianthus annuus]
MPSPLPHEGLTKWGLIRWVHADAGKGGRRERVVWGEVHSNLNQSHIFPFFLKFTTSPNV